ncbi:carbonic anhydrase [Bifidobacterium sp. SMB2]|uniref:Carbonic anhydrase n=1 Tax=Bifidobacterium saimiriisciurei TaxID=2661627 RepID=A0ABX0CHE2_9BIFI|nr:MULTISPECIES: carbonic anhydrase [Bifidobacterium]NEG95559.1 carbonic anhydrase [Bifidobacterium sp. SMB2]NEH11717.1 carbonic anhydrase [Bifidobacterium saimiriisciurei]
MDAQARIAATWSRLIEGNRRFAEGEAQRPHQDRTTRESLVGGQHPDAAVLSCSDSRVPPEIVFDQGLGDLFDIRTAGEVVDDAVLESLEYAIQHLHVCLIVVMGHENCGAVAAAMKVLAGDENTEDEGFRSILMREVGASARIAFAADDEATAEDVERIHVAQTIEALVTDSPVIRGAVRSGEVAIVGARYKISDGKVEVLSF